jgi:hypothetical protein
MAVAIFLNRDVGDEVRRLISNSEFGILNAKLK